MEGCRMSEWDIKIIKADNGYICEWEESGEDNFIIKKKHVIEDKSDDKNFELNSMQELLYFIKEYFAVYDSKHNEKNINIEIK
jgi:hypothetical protein